MKKQSERPGRDARRDYSVSRNVRKGKAARYGPSFAPSMRQGLVPESQDETVYEQRKEAS